MALISCPECGREISDSSQHCIHCGYQMIKSEKQKNKIQEVINKFGIKKILIIATVIIVALVAVMTLGGGSKLKAKKDIQGTWAKSFQYDGVTMEAQIIFKKGKVTSQVCYNGDPLGGDTTKTGKYYVTNKEIVMKYDGASSEQTIPYSYEGGKIVLEDFDFRKK